MNAEIGDSLYCQAEGWSGEIVNIIGDDDADFIVAIIKNHDPTEIRAWLCVPLNAYSEISKASLN